MLSLLRIQLQPWSVSIYFHIFYNATIITVVPLYSFVGFQWLQLFHNGSSRNNPFNPFHSLKKGDSVQNSTKCIRVWLQIKFRCTFEIVITIVPSSLKITSWKDLSIIYELPFSIMNHLLWQWQWYFLSSSSTASLSWWFGTSSLLFFTTKQSRRSIRS